MSRLNEPAYAVKALPNAVPSQFEHISHDLLTRCELTGHGMQDTFLQVGKKAASHGSRRALCP